MNKLAQNQKYELTVEFINKTVQRAFTRGKMVSKLSGNKWGYTGKTKSEENASNNEDVTFSVSWKGDGALVLAAIVP